MQRMHCGSSLRASSWISWHHPVRSRNARVARRRCIVSCEGDTASVRLNKRIGFLGPGHMAEALARGFVNAGLVQYDHISCAGSKSGRNEVFRNLGAIPYDSNLQVVLNSDIVFISVKPYYVFTVLEEIKAALTDKHTVVCIAAGIPLSKLAEAAGPEVRLVRVMPNTPSFVGEGAAAMCLGGKVGLALPTNTLSLTTLLACAWQADKADEVLVRRMFEAVGKIYTVEERHLSAVTGVSGSGPAYIFMIIEAMADGGVRAGLPRDVAQALAAQTVLGSAKMVLETGKHPGALKDMVTSPGGTTIAAVHELEKAGVRCAMINAVVAATNRADQLSNL